MVANDVSAPGSGFEVDTNTVRIISGDDETQISGSKEEVADAIWEAAVCRWLPEAG
jgi:phosphopantothenoylcysteine synthetase/decarboxylase